LANSRGKKARRKKRNAQVGNITQRGRRECGRAAAIAPKLLSASLDGAARGSKVRPHRDNASRKWGRAIKPLYNQSL